MERLWSRVKKTRNCWLWTGALNGRGYGVIGAGKKGFIKYVHRLVWERIHGPIPSNKEICHSCDTPSCVRPDHLFLGTHLENMNDMAIKLRSGRTKISIDDVRKIIKLYKNNIPRRKIVSITQINVNTIKSILYGYHWNHITGLPKKY